MKRCPTPDKIGYPAQRAALSALHRWGRATVRAYKCRCGAWHLTSSPKPKPRRTAS